MIVVKYNDDDDDDAVWWSGRNMSCVKPCIWLESRPRHLSASSLSIMEAADAAFLVSLRHSYQSSHVLYFFYLCRFCPLIPVVHLVDYGSSLFPIQFLV